MIVNFFKKYVFSNFGLKLLSIAMAFFLWLLVINVSKPEITDQKSVQLEVKNEDAFARDEKTWEIDRTTVTVSYNVRTDMRSSITAADFHAYIDLNDYSITGSVPIYVEVLNGKDDLMENVTLRPTVIHVTIEDIQTKKFEVKSTTVGEPKSGYEVAEVVANPTSVNVTGPESQIGRISSVGFEADVTDISEDKTGVAEPVYYDANGNVIELQNVSASSAQISYTVKLNKEKAVNLLCSVSGVPQDGYQYESMTVSPDSVLLSALPENVDNMSVLALPAVDITNQQDNLTVSYDIRDYLPDGVSLAEGEENMINVTVRIEKLPETKRAVEESETETETQQGPGEETSSIHDASTASHESARETDTSGDHGNTETTAKEQPGITFEGPTETAHTETRTSDNEAPAEANKEDASTEANNVLKTG